MKALSIAAKWLFLLCLPILLLAISISWTANSLWLYKYGFTKYEISQTTELVDIELEKAARGLITYFNSDDEYIGLTVVKDDEPFELFNQREIIHLKDVKGLISLDYQVLLGSLIYVLGYTGVSLFRQRTEDWRRLAREVVAGSSLALASMLALGLGTLLGFDRLFLQFHLISFANDFWQLDPSRDYLIMLFPQGFWFDTTLFVILATVAMALILNGAAIGHLLFNKKMLTVVDQSISKFELREQ